MACNSRSSCGPDFEQMRLWLKGIILELLNDGTLQAGLKDCEGEWLGKARNVVLCDKLADLLCDLINEGKLCVPKIAGFTSDCDAKTLTITMADGTELTADASCFGGSGADGNTKIQSFTYDPQTGVVKIVDTENREFEVTIAVKDTKNKAMAWEPDKQEVSVTDTEDNKVSTVVTFPVTERPPVSQGPAPTRFIGKSGELFLGEPAVWMRMLLPDGRVGRMPVFLEDQIIRACVPYERQKPEVGGPDPILISANAYKAGDSLTTWANRLARMPSFNMEYLPDRIPLPRWKEFAQHIYNWLEQDEGSGINPSDYQVYIPVVGYVPLAYLLELEPLGTLGERKYFHAFSDTEPMEVYAIDDPSQYGISGEDGNIYRPPNPECGINREPHGQAVPIWVSLTYANVTSGWATEFVESKRVNIDAPVGKIAYHPNGLWKAIVAAAIQLRTELGLDWLASSDPDGNPQNERSYVATINTPFGSLDVQGTFDYNKYWELNNVDPLSEDKFVSDAMGLHGWNSLAPYATLFPFHKQDEIVIEDVPNTNVNGKSRKKIRFDQAKKNLLRLVCPYPNGGFEPHFETSVVEGLQPYDAYFRSYYD